MPIASFGQEKTQVIQDQSKAWPELLLGQPEGLENSPKDPDHNNPQQKPGGRAGQGLRHLLLPSPAG